MPRVTVRGVPDWVDPPRLLGPGDWARGGPDAWVAELDRRAAADLMARLRGLGMGGRPLTMEAVPPPKRALIREARTADARRRRITTPGFTRRGTRLDDEARHSLTPEALALAIGRRAAGRAVVDATCGAGGNAIGFARAGCSVVAVELRPERLADARHNARVYGVEDRIRFVAGRAEEQLADLPGDLVFLDVPWTDAWDRIRTGLGDLPLLAPLIAAAGDREVWAKVPPSFDPAALPDWTPEAWLGRAEGDRYRVKFVLMASSPRPRPS